MGTMNEALFEIAKDRDSNPREIKNIIKEGGFDVNAKDEVAGRTALMWVALFNSDPEMINVLISLGADVDAQDNDGNTALMIAATYGKSSEVVKALIEAHANLNIQDSEGHTALMLAADLERVEAVKLLVEAGADLSIEDNNGSTVFEYARWNDEIKRIIRNATR